MRALRDAFPECEREPYEWEVEAVGFDPPSDYTVLILSGLDEGTRMLLDVRLGSYQGDAALLLGAPDGRYGFLAFGYGSCSGCDALDGCESYEELEELRTSLVSSIQWGSREEMLSKAIDPDWKEMSYHADDEEWLWFKKEAERLLEAIA